MKLLLGVPVFCLISTAVAAGNAATDEAEQAALQQITKLLPPCGVQCLATYVPASGCSLTDTACICTNSDLTLAVGGCLLANCTVSEALKVQGFQQTSCGAPVRSKQAKTHAISWALWAVSVLAVAGRFATRSEKLGGAGYGWDDWTILVTAGLLTAITVVGHFMIEAGLGKDMWMLKPDNITSVLQYFWVEEMLYSYCVSLTKISIVLFYLRIFPNTVSSTFRKICFALIGVLTVAPTIFVITTIFQCSPVSYSWTRWDGEHKGHCFNVLAQIYAGSAYNTAFDLIVFALPIPRLMKVQISTRKKIGICITFLVGLFVTVCSIIRLSYVIRWRTTTNPTWTYNPIALWSLIECDVGVICACMPALAGPIKRTWMWMVGDKLSSLYNSHSRKNSTEIHGSQHARAESRGWSGASRSDTKEGKNSIMCNTYLNVSDEVELVGKGEQHQLGAVQGGENAHGYRQRW